MTYTATFDGGPMDGELRAMSEDKPKGLLAVDRPHPDMLRALREGDDSYDGPMTTTGEYVLTSHENEGALVHYAWAGDA